MFCFIVGIYRVHEKNCEKKKLMTEKELMHSFFEAFFFLPFSLMICFNMLIISKKNIHNTEKSSCVSCQILTLHKKETENIKNVNFVRVLSVLSCSV